MNRVGASSGRNGSSSRATISASELSPPSELATAFNEMLDRLEEGVERLSGFAADLAHDLRTPVNALMMQTQVALAKALGGGYHASNT